MSAPYWLFHDELDWFGMDLSHDAVADPDVDELLGVHVLHRWDRRSEPRQELQRRWGRELARRDHGSS